MPLFMDVHTLDGGVDPDAPAEAHRPDSQDRPVHAREAHDPRPATRRREEAPMRTDNPLSAAPTFHRIDTAIRCPTVGCPAPTSVTDVWDWPSSDGPVRHARTRCQQGHVSTMPTDWLVQLVS